MNNTINNAKMYSSYGLGVKQGRLAFLNGMPCTPCGFEKIKQEDVREFNKGWVVGWRSEEIENTGGW